MSKITITFDGLCAFFTGNLENDRPELIVGLIDVSDWPGTPEMDYHYPVLTIKTEGRVLKKYEGFASKADSAYGLDKQGNFFGSIYLDAPEGTPLIKKVMDNHDGHEDHAAHGLLPFDNFIMIDRDIFDGQDLNVDMDLCKAKLFIKNGLLFSLREQDSLTFNDLESDKTLEFEQRTTMPGVELTFSDESYVVLHFQRNAEDFVFKGGMDYQVTLTNEPLASHEHERERLARHFKYFYNLIVPEQQPSEVFVPQISREPNAGAPDCMPGGYDEP